MSRNKILSAHKRYFARGSVKFTHFHDSFFQCAVSKPRSYKIFAKLLLGSQESVRKVFVLKIFLLIEIKSQYNSNLLVCFIFITGVLNYLKNSKFRFFYEHSLVFILVVTKYNANKLNLNIYSIFRKYEFENSHLLNFI